MTPIRFLLLFGLALASATSPARAGQAPHPLTIEELFGDPVIARAQGGVEVRQSQLDRAFIAYTANLAGRGDRIPPDQRTQREALLLERMLTTQLLTNRATTMDQKVARTQAEEFYTRTKTEAGSDEQFLRQLKLSGLTPEQFNDRIYEQALAEAVLERELDSQIKVSDEEINQFYEAGTDVRVQLLQKRLAAQQAKPNADPTEIEKLQAFIRTVQTNNLQQLQSPETVRVAHVMLSRHTPDRSTLLPKEQQDQKRERALQLLAQARGGADFMELVRQHSEDRNLPETGGVYTFSRNDRYAPEFVAASFSLQPGQISDIVETDFGFHIIKLLEINPPEKIPFDKIKDNLATILKKQKLQRAMPAFFRQLKQNARVEILEARYREALPEEASTEEP